MRIFIRPVAGIVGTVAALAALATIGLHYWPGTQKVTVAAAAMVPLLLTATVALAVVCLLYARAFIRLAVAIAVAVAAIVVQAPLWRGEAAPSGKTLAVLTSNIQLGQGDVGELAKLVRENDVDFLAVEELTPEAAQRIAGTTIAADLPHSFVRPDRLAYGTALYSRYPLSSTATVPGFALATLTAVATVPGRGDVQLFAVHPVPPLEPSDWADELKKIEALLHGVPEPRPVIALGDYNATYDHVQFRRLLAGGYRDAGQLAGAGWLPTYPTDKTYPPLVGIDHVLVRGLGAAEVTGHEVSGADHLALLARVG
ncbi:endonuclease/exonuclease/phosphatase family protein [Tsukamurella pseudospumae]|uniref:Endonuclease n=1 Tax=Tsukamurella pseudospumae TaxID=239498 RepID=A0A138AW51_9ACTN|nr:endonuclease/exonuclease/phosphatase family protein [Tsukamurella pseudospumae]KXP14642.1 endonuclease [Tsukamurella pseudospumae]